MKLGSPRNTPFLLCQFWRVEEARVDLLIVLFHLGDLGIIKWTLICTFYKSETEGFTNILLRIAFSFVHYDSIDVNRNIAVSKVSRRIIADAAWEYLRVLHKY